MLNKIKSKLLNWLGIEQLRSGSSHNYHLISELRDEIKALKIAVKMAKEDHESLKTFHN